MIFDNHSTGKAWGSTDDFEVSDRVNPLLDKLGHETFVPLINDSRVTSLPDSV